MDIINFVDEFGVPHCVEVEQISKEEYDRFGGSEITLSTNTFYEETDSNKGEKIMLKLNPGVIYDANEKPFILTSGGLALPISAETEVELHKWEYERVAAYIEEKAAIIQERAMKIFKEDIEPAHEQMMAEKHHHQCGCGCNHDHKSNNGYFGNLIAKHMGTGEPQEKPYDPVAENKIRKPKPKPYSGIFGRYVNGDAPNPIKEVIAPEHHQDFTSSLRYYIDPNGVVYVHHTKTGATDIADAGEIDVLYRHCPQFKVEYDNMVRSRVGQPIYTGNPIQDMMNGMGGFAR
jgi:hypothetical protein